MDLTRRTILLAAAAAPLAVAVRTAAAQHDEVTLTHLTAPAGIGEYEWGLAVDRILGKNSSWLRQRSQPTQGYIYNLRTAIDSESRWGTLVFNIDPISPWLAAQKRPPFREGLGKLEIRGLMNATWPIWTLMTRDPSVKTAKDLDGRRIALGPKAGTATVMMEETLKTAGVFDKVKLQYLSFADVTNGLLDGTIDVGLANLWYNAPANKIGPTQGLINLEASDKGFHYVAFDKTILEKTRDGRHVPYKILTVPNGTLPLQTEEMTVYANPDYVGVAEKFPEEIAYEYVRLVIEHLGEINQSGGLGALFTPDFLAYGIDNLHPGALRAYREAGLVK
jgi:TRAP transporter TAXI family solute receptor